MSTTVDLSPIWEKLKIQPIVGEDLQIGTIHITDSDFTCDEAVLRIERENISIQNTGYQLVALTHKEALEAKSSGALRSIISWMTPALNPNGKFLRYHRRITHAIPVTRLSDMPTRAQTHVLVKLVRCI